MRIHAGVVASLLEADLNRSGWNGSKDSYPDQTPRQAALASISKSIVKKYLMGTRDTTPEADAAALVLFERVNESCRTFQFGTAGRPDWERIALGEAKTFLYDFFFRPCKEPISKDWGFHEEPVLNLSSILRGLDTGPGSSLGSPGTDRYSKFALSGLTATSSALHDIYVQAIAYNPTWRAMENLRAIKCGYTIAESSRLSFVPKTAEISRTICTEPVLNMMFQKGIGKVLEGRMRQVLGINLSHQPDKNRALARVGSLTGEFGTIDLSSASDSMSLTLVDEFFPASVVKWLKLTSCRSTILPDGRKLELHMISSMGNAFTFPLQTIFFSSLVYGAYKTLGIPIKCPKGGRLGNFAVFGDDIIVCKQAYNLVCVLLHLTGFTVNVTKSFNEGFFRESCGSDYYQGYNIRGVYIKRLRDASDCYSAINRLNRWSALHGVPLVSLVRYLRSQVRYLPIPPDEDDSAGIKIPSCLLNKKVFRDKNTGGIIYRYLKLKPSSFSVDAPFNGERRPRYSTKPRGFYENVDGLMFCLLAGSIRNGRIGHRSSVRKAVVKRGYSSRWDYIPSDQVVRPDFDMRWKSYVDINLFLG